MTEEAGLSRGSLCYHGDFVELGWRGTSGADGGPVLLQEESQTLHLSPRPGHPERRSAREPHRARQRQDQSETPSRKITVIIILYITCSYHRFILTCFTDH